MNRSSKDLRQVFLKLKQSGLKTMEISKVLGKSRVTINSWNKLTEEQLLKEPSKVTRKTKIDLISLKEYFEKHPFAFNHEIGDIFGRSKSTIHRWRVRLGFKYKKAKTTYGEANLESKKTSNNN